VKSLWNDKEAGKFQGDLALRVYTSRLLGQDTSLVLHGGGNTSVKIREKNILGDDEELLYVKGSGWDLEKIEEGGFSPVRLQHLIELAKLPFSIVPHFRASLFAVGRKPAGGTG